MPGTKSAVLFAVTADTGGKDSAIYSERLRSQVVSSESIWV